MNKIVLILSFWISFVLVSKAQSPQGTTSVTLGNTYTYSYGQGTTFPSVSWTAVKGTVTNSWSQGPVYFASVTWNTVGAGSVTISGVNTSTPTLNVTITTCPVSSPPTPTSSGNGCGPQVISYSGSP